MNDDSRDVREARSRYNARRTESSLIAWVCSPQWYDHGDRYEIDRDIRGAQYKRGSTFALNARSGDTFHGEIA